MDCQQRFQTTNELSHSYFERKTVQLALEPLVWKVCNFLFIHFFS